MRGGLRPRTCARGCTRRDGDRRCRCTRASTSRTPGPSFETPAEIRAFRTLGADLVGMSHGARGDRGPPRRASRGGPLRGHEPRRGDGDEPLSPRADPGAGPAAPARLAPLIERWLQDAWQPDLAPARRRASPCLDLTASRATRTTRRSTRCAPARARRGPVAAVGVGPGRAPAGPLGAAGRRADRRGANFPEGDLDAGACAGPSAAGVAGGADEIDVVLPWRAWLAGDRDGALEVVRGRAPRPAAASR